MVGAQGDPPGTPDPPEQSRPPSALPPPPDPTLGQPVPPSPYVGPPGPYPPPPGAYGPPGAYAPPGAFRPGVSRGDAMGRSVLSGILIGMAAGAVSGTVSFGPLGTLFGLVFGAMAAVVPTLIGAGIIAGAGGDDPASFRRRVDVVLSAIGGLMAILSVWWLAQGALSGPGAPIGAFITVLVGLVLARRWIHQLAPPEPDRPLLY